MPPAEPRNRGDKSTPINLEADRTSVLEIAVVEPKLLCQAGDGDPLV
jgi:hypothetical protein